MATSSAETAAGSSPGVERSYGANSFFALIAYIVPAISALVAVRIYVKGLGTSGYGLLTLIAAVTGYSGLLELGLGQAVIRYLSYYRALNEGHTVLAIIRVVGLWLFAAGIVGAVVLYFCAPWLIQDVLKVPQSLHAQGILALRLSSLNVVLGLLLSLGTALPVSFLRYDLASAATVVFGTGSNVGPAILVWLGHGIVSIVVFFVVSNFVAILTYGTMGVYLVRPLARDRGPGWREIRRKVLGFAGFVAVGRVNTTVAAQTSRVMVGAVVNAAGAAFYYIPNMLAGQLGSLLSRIGQVLFPTGAALIARQDFARLRVLYLRVSRLLFLLNGAVTAAVCAFADPLLRYWTDDPRYAREGAVALVIFALTQSINSAAQPVGYLSWSAERAGVNLAFNTANTVITLAALYPLTVLWGVRGAALAALLGSLTSPVFMVYGHRHIVHVDSPTVFRQCYVPTVLGAAAAGLIGVLVLRGLASNLATTLLLWTLTVLIGMAVSGLLGALTRADVDAVLRALSRLWPRGRLSRSGAGGGQL